MMKNYVLRGNLIKAIIERIIKGMIWVLVLLYFAYSENCFSQNIKEGDYKAKIRDSVYNVKGKGADLEALKEFIYNQNQESIPDDPTSEEGELHDIEETIEYYEKLLVHPLNINSATEQQLRRLRILSDFQIAALKEYIRSTGAIISFAELKYIYGFNQQIVDLISPFIRFGEAIPEGNYLSISTSSLQIKYYNKYNLLPSSLQSSSESTSQSKYNFSDDYFQLKYKFDYREKFKLSFLIEKDSGEPYIGKNKIPLSDFISANISFHSIRYKSFDFESIVIGDFNTMFGQGLTLCSRSSLFGYSIANGYQKTGESISPYTSSDEYNFYRGVALKINKGRFSFTPIVSYKGIDASLTEDGKYKSIKTNGKHTTINAIDNQNSIHELIFGMNGTYSFSNFRIGLSYCGYSYDRFCGVEPKYYNQYDLYDGLEHNIAADFYAIFKRFSIYGEGAFSSPQSKYGNSGGIAALLGGNFISDKFSFNFITRYYSKEYIAPHSGAYSAISSISNQIGASLALQFALAPKLNFTSMCDYTLFPYYRYNIKASSSSSKLSLKLTWSDGKYFAPSSNEFSLSLSYKYRVKYYSSKEVFSLYSIRSNCKVTLWNNFLVGIRGEYNSLKSIAISTTLNYKILRERAKLHLGFTYYNVSKWDGRIYLYEYDLPSTFSSNMLYRQGRDFYGVITYKLLKYLTLSLKVQQRKEILNIRTYALFSF